MFSAVSDVVVDGVGFGAGLALGILGLGFMSSLTVQSVESVGK